MAYVQPSSMYRDESLDGFFSAIGGAFKKGAGFVVKKVAPTALSFVPVVGAPLAAAYSSIPGIRTPAQYQYVDPVFPTRLPMQALPAPPPPDIPWWKRAIQAAATRAGEDPRFREGAVEYTSRYAPPELLAAAAARQAARAPTVVKAGLTAATLLPIVAVGALLLRRR